MVRHPAGRALGRPDDPRGHAVGCVPSAASADRPAPPRGAQRRRVRDPVRERVGGVRRSAPDRYIDLVRLAFEAFGGGTSTPAFADFSADVEWRMSTDEPDARTHRGIAAVRRFVDSLADPWANRFSDVMQFEPLIDRGDAVVVPWTARVAGRESGIVLDINETYVVTVRGGAIVRVDEYRTTEEAFRGP